MQTEIIPLSEGVFTVGHERVFLPFDPEHDDLNARPKGSLLVEVQPFLLKHLTAIILLDTGLGFTLSNGEMQLHQNLLQHNINPEDVTHVVLSHLHKDHAGGTTLLNECGEHVLSFPKANYYVSRQEMEYALQMGRPSYFTEEFELLMNHPNVIWLDGSGTIDNLIRYETVGGHCPYHLSLLFDDGEQKIFYGGDVAPQMNQLKTKYVAKYDYDGTLSMQLRQQFAEKGKEQEWTFLFYHDAALPMSKLV
jgi:Metal-dependent hydrolases of the beta-lactamase superfamily II